LKLNGDGLFRKGSIPFLDSNLFFDLRRGEFGGY
jgi:hypothetical protein